MTKLFLLINLMFLTISSCSKNDNQTPKGIIESSPEIEVNKSTQYSFNSDVLDIIELDTLKRFDQAIADSLVKWVNEVKQKGNYKGLTCAVGIPQKGFWNYAIGESGTESQLQTNTKFHTQSLSKMFTAAIVVKFIEEQQIGLDDTIEKWFPDCPRANEITIRHLLCHTSGVQTFDALYEFQLNDTNNFSEEELLSMSFEYPINNSPDTYFSYTNTGYLMLGCILQEVSNMSLSQIFNEYLISPLKLKSTVVCSDRNLDMGIVRGFDGNNLTDLNEWPRTYAAGPLISTPTEIIILHNYLLSDFFSSQESLNLMFSDMNIWKKSPDTYYGKGIYIIKDLPIGDYIGHAGGDTYFRTCVFYNPQNKISIAIFSNTNASPIEPAMFFLTEKLSKLIN